MIILSGYRPKQLNQLIGGSKYSAHIDLRAADIRVIGHSPAQVFKWLIQSPFIKQCDQVILEFGRWVHIGISDKPRQQVLKAFKKDGQTCYDFVNTKTLL